jgi:hypothetical protein
MTVMMMWMWMDLTIERVCLFIDKCSVNKIRWPVEWVILTIIVGIYKFSNRNLRIIINTNSHDT